jgi:hypothetical protein
MAEGKEMKALMLYPVLECSATELQRNKYCYLVNRYYWEIGSRSESVREGVGRNGKSSGPVSREAKDAGVDIRPSSCIRENCRKGNVTPKE